MREDRYRQVRCEQCHARLFDTDAPPVDQGGPGVEVVIRCWRCKAIVVARLGQAAGDMLYSSQRET
jgi:DNA-directed RNA polymerase subunit RPC12/RpoP